MSKQNPPHFATIEVMLVSHTNAGKTTLLRTLLGRDVGEVLDAADVTTQVEPFELIRGVDGQSLLLFDTPGFGDSFRLARRLNIKNPCLAWLVREVWDRLRNPRLWRGQRLAIDLRNHADVILYLVNAVERPVDAVYVAPELDVLSCIGKPVLVILNQGNNPQHPELENATIQEWHGFFAGYMFIKKSLSLDSYSRCWLQELVLYEQIGKALDGSKRDTYLKLEEAIKEAHHDRFSSSIKTLSAYLLKIASDKVELKTGWRANIDAVWSSIRKNVPWRNSVELLPQELAMKSLAQRYMDESKFVTDSLIAINQLTGASSAELVEFVAEEFTFDGPVDAPTTALAGGVISGALTGLAADMMAGGMTLGAGMLVGAVLGAVGSAALAQGYNMYTDKEKRMVGWSAKSLSDAYERAMLLYLAVAHYGRGQGEWKRNADSTHWRVAVRDAVEMQRSKLEELWTKVSMEGASPGVLNECEYLMTKLLCELLLKQYPQAKGQFSMRLPVDSTRLGIERHL